MQLDAMLDRCRRLEERAAGLYRSWAAASRSEPALCALWTELAREEEAHARSIADAAARLPAVERWQVHLEGWNEAIAEIEERLGAAEQLGGGVPIARQLGAALRLEMSELESLRRTLLAVGHRPEGSGQEQHALRLAERAAALSDDPDVGMQAALLRAQARLGH